MAPYRLPMVKVFPPGKEKDVGAMKSFTESPEPASQLQSK